MSFIKSNRNRLSKSFLYTFYRRYRVYFCCDWSKFFYNFELSCILLKDNYITDERLVKIKDQRMKFMETNKVIRGIRFFAGLPVNGQRTHSNYKTSKLNKRVA